MSFKFSATLCKNAGCCVAKCQDWTIPIFEFRLCVIVSGVKATKSVKITEDYSLPVSVTFIVNPRAEISYLVFGLTF